MTNTDKQPRKVLDHLIAGEKHIKTFFIPYKTTSIFGLIIWTLSLLLPIVLIILGHNTEEISEDTQKTIDIIMGIWIIIVICLLLLFGYGERYLVLTNKRIIYYRDFNLLFMKRLKKIREYTAKIEDVKLVERNQCRYPDIVSILIGGLMIIAGASLWIFQNIAERTDLLTEEEIYQLNLISIIIIVLAGIIIILNVFFISKKHYKVILVIDQTFPLPNMMELFFSQNVKSGYWVIRGWRKDAKKMYGQVNNLIFELQESNEE